MSAMRIPSSRVALGLVSLGMLSAAACTTSDPAAGGVSSTPKPTISQHGGTDPQSDLAFAQGACGGCHAVEPLQLSPNPRSPSFVDIANSPGLTDDTLAVWLADAHNYPEDMDFDLNEEQVQTIARHMLRLRDPDYEKPVS